MIHGYSLKKLTGLHEQLAPQMNQLPEGPTHSQTVDQEGPPEGSDSIRLPTNNLPPHNMEAPVRQHFGQDE